MAARRAHGETDILADTRAFEAWQRQQVPLDAAALRRKHAQMDASLPRFLRGTYYRWARRFPVVCGALAGTTPVPSVGDVHVENFGTWRDVEGRLAWGVNDVDEAWPLPQAHDLVRLLTSAIVLHDTDDAGRLALAPRAMVRSVLAGYQASLDRDGVPHILAESHAMLREQALHRLHDPVEYWAKLDGSGTTLRRVPSVPAALLRAALPAGAVLDGFRSRQAGVGSLGRPRILALARWHDALVAREAKAWLPSASAWATGTGRAVRWSARLVAASRQPRDPYLVFDRRGWVIRRLAPDCSRIDLEKLPGARDERELLHAMGAEIANLHLGLTPRRTLQAGAGRWAEATLLRAAQDMAADLATDWQRWRAR